MWSRKSQPSSEGSHRWTSGSGGRRLSAGRTARAAAVAHLAAVRFIPPDHHDESLANATVRQDLLTIVGQMRQHIESGRKGLGLFATLVGSWMHGGRRPTRATLSATRDSIELGLKGMDALDALALAFEQRVRWFDASRSTPTEDRNNDRRYARKSTDQTGVADEQKSVARQVEHERQYAAQGLDRRRVICVRRRRDLGGEFANRPGFLRRMNSLKPRPRFQVLVMSEESRLGREAIETAYALKQLVQAQ